MARLFPDDIPYLEETDKRKKKLFYTENPLELIADLLKIFEKIFGLNSDLQQGCTRHTNTSP